MRPDTAFDIDSEELAASLRKLARGIEDREIAVMRATTAETADPDQPETIATFMLRYAGPSEYFEKLEYQAGQGRCKNCEKPVKVKFETEVAESSSESWHEADERPGEIIRKKIVECECSRVVADRKGTRIADLPEEWDFEE